MVCVPRFYIPLNRLPSPFTFCRKMPSFALCRPLKRGFYLTPPPCALTHPRVGLRREVLPLLYTVVLSTCVIHMNFTKLSSIYFFGQGTSVKRKPGKNEAAPTPTASSSTLCSLFVFSWPSPPVLNLNKKRAGNYNL